MFLIISTRISAEKQISTNLCGNLRERLSETVESTNLKVNLEGFFANALIMKMIGIRAWLQQHSRQAAFRTRDNKNNALACGCLQICQSQYSMLHTEW